MNNAAARRARKGEPWEGLAPRRFKASSASNVRRMRRRVERVSVGMRESVLAIARLCNNRERYLNPILSTSADCGKLGA